MKKAISKNLKKNKNLLLLYKFFLFSCVHEINLSLFNILNILNKKESKELEIFNILNAFKEFFQTSTSKKKTIIIK
jgi:hypothetical protein